MFKGEKKASQAYVIVCGNEKGGSGKTTTMMHITIALLNAGYSVASLDLDSRQQSFSRYLGNRENFSNRHGINLKMPKHYVINRDHSDFVSESEQNELDNLLGVIGKIQETHDFILIDTPGHDGYLMRMAHSIADTLITPLNDSYIDFDVLGLIDPETSKVDSLSHYARMVREARRKRRIADDGILDWVVFRNRLTQISSRNKESMFKSLNSLSMQLGCRLADGISERVIYRELFPHGLTALDDLETILPDKRNVASHLSARQEVRSLISSLRLPIDELTKKRKQSEKAKAANNNLAPMDTLGM